MHDLRSAAAQHAYDNHINHDSMSSSVQSTELSESVGEHVL